MVVDVEISGWRKQHIFDFQAGLYDWASLKVLRGALGEQSRGAPKIG